MFQRRLAPAGSSSPPQLSHQLSNESTQGFRRPSTIDDTEGNVMRCSDDWFRSLISAEPRSSPASVRGQRSGRGTRATKTTRRSKLQESTPASSRHISKTSVDESQDNGDEEKHDEEDEDVDMDDEEDDEATTPSGKANRAAGKPERGRGAKRGRKSTRRGTRRR